MSVFFTQCCQCLAGTVDTTSLIEGGREMGRPWQMPDWSFDLIQPPSGIFKIAAV